ncbi:hypothetical protein D3C72_980490 [compost metagenome]
MVDHVLTDELELLVGVFLVDAHAALRQRHAELVLLAVHVLEHHLDLLLAAVLGVGCLRAVEDEDLLGGEVRRRQERHLLRLVLLEGGAAAQVVGVVLEKRLLGELGLGGALHHHVRRHRLGAAHGVVGVLGAVDVARHQREARVGVGGAALVPQRDPAGHVGLGVVGAAHEHVVGLPAHAGGHVTGLDRLGAGALHVEQPDQTRLRDQIRRQVRQDHLAGRLQVNLVADAVDVALVGADQGGLEDLRRLAVLGGRADLDLLAHVLLHELGRGDQVVLVVLLEHVHAVGVRDRAEADAGGVDLARDVAEAQRQLAFGQRQPAGVFDQAQVVVVDGDGEVLALAGAAGDGRHLRLGDERRGQQEGHGQGQSQEAQGGGRRRHGVSLLSRMGAFHGTTTCRSGLFDFPHRHSITSRKLGKGG